jgi:ribonuclease BN (tRNA processing enzyme)
MQVTFLGTNGWYASETGNTVSIVIETENFYVILDAGDGIYKIDEYIKNNKPIVIFLSHLHLDHIIGFHSFAKLQFSQKIDIIGYKGVKKGLNTIIDHPYSSPFNSLPLNIEFHEIEEGFHNIRFPFEARLLEHVDPTLGFRFKIDKKTISYCTDTGMCDNLYVLAENADLLITECSYKPGQEEWGWLHLKPEESAEIAKKSNVGNLILTHFDASYYKTIEDREIAGSKAREIFPNTQVAKDNIEFILN